MRVAGSASWRFAEGIDEAPLVALFVRDALGLEVPTGVTIPPRLDGELPDYSELIVAERRAAAGAAWTGWWQQIAAQEFRGHQGAPTGEKARDWMRSRVTEHQAVFDPPEFASLADRPALAEAAQVTIRAALRWTNARRQTLLMPPQGRPSGQLDYDTVRAAAEQAGRRHHVGLDAVQACAMVLPVEGIWWTLFAPGAVLCSVHAARDRSTAQRVLAEAFESGLER